MFGFFKRKGILMSTYMFSNAVKNAMRDLNLKNNVLSDEQVIGILENVIERNGIKSIENINYIMVTTTNSIYWIRNEWVAIYPQMIAYILSSNHCSLSMNLWLKDIDLITEETSKHFESFRC